MSVDRDLLEAMTAVVAAHAPSTSRHGALTVDRAAWQHLDELGLVRLTGAEAYGGSGAGWLEAAALLSVAARAGLALPLAEHDLMAGWLAEELGLTPIQGLSTIALVDADGLSSEAPWADQATTVLVLGPTPTGWRLVATPASDLTLAPGWNLAGEPRPRLQVDPARLASGVPVLDEVRHGLRLRAALARAVQVVGALEQAQALTLTHVTSRIQFGRTLSKFQAVQHQLADLAAETALARAAVDAAVTAVDADDPRLAFLVAVARSCAGHAATVVVRVAHQLHGAIGTTAEHDLHRFTLPVLAWRSEFGSTAGWDQAIADAAATVTPADLWALISD